MESMLGHVGEGGALPGLCSVEILAPSMRCGRLPSRSDVNKISCELLGLQSMVNMRLNFVQETDETSDAPCGHTRLFLIPGSCVGSRVCLPDASLNESLCSTACSNTQQMLVASYYNYNLPKTFCVSRNCCASMCLRRMLLCFDTFVSFKNLPCGTSCISRLCSSRCPICRATSDTCFSKGQCCTACSTLSAEESHAQPDQGRGVKS